MDFCWNEAISTSRAKETTQQSTAQQNDANQSKRSNIGAQNGSQIGSFGAFSVEPL